MSRLANDFDRIAADGGSTASTLSAVILRDSAPAPRRALDNTAQALLAAKTKPRLIGRYLLCDPIAAGGMAQVHLGRSLGAEGFSRIVAIKQLLPHFARDEEFVKMFLEEARLLSRIHHPHVVAPIDVVRLESELFIVMEYVHGEALADLTKRSQEPVPPRVAAAIMTAVLLGLHAGHEACDESGEPLQIVHGDVSPQNILVGGDGLARVVDFGIAKAASRHHTTQNRELRGKLGYFTPEQLRLERTDRRSDVFTAGIVLWELLTGRRLFAGESPAALASEMLAGRIARPSSIAGSPRELDDIVLKALALTPADRYATAQQMADELCSALPPASAPVVREWVNELATSTLARRAEMVSDLETLSIHELTLPALPPLDGRRAASNFAASPVIALGRVASREPASLGAAAGVTEVLEYVPSPAATPASAAPASPSNTGAPASATITPTRPRSWTPALLIAALFGFAGLAVIISGVRLGEKYAPSATARNPSSVDGATSATSAALPAATTSATSAVRIATTASAGPRAVDAAPPSSFDSAMREPNATATKPKAAPQRKPAKQTAKTRMETSATAAPAGQNERIAPAQSERARLMEQIRESKKP